MLEKKMYLVQGDLSFWGYRVYGVYSTYAKAQERIASLVRNLDKEEAQELSSDLNAYAKGEKDDYKGLLIFDIAIDEDTYTIE